MEDWALIIQLFSASTPTTLHMQGEDPCILAAKELTLRPDIFHSQHAICLDSYSGRTIIIHRGTQLPPTLNLGDLP